MIRKESQCCFYVCIVIAMFESKDLTCLSLLMRHFLAICYDDDEEQQIYTFQLLPT